MTSHVIECPCGWRIKVDGWLDALDLRDLHNRFDGHAAVIELNMRNAS